MNALASRILISIRWTEKRRGSAVEQRRRGINGSRAPSTRLDLRVRRHLFREHKGQCLILMPLHCDRALALVFLVLVIMGAAPRPAPHLRDKNLIKGASAGILEPRNSRGTARGPEEHHC